MKLVIDFRMHLASGIGSYIRNLVPKLVDVFEITLIGPCEEIQKYSFNGKIEVINASSKIYSISEQLELFWKTPACDYFWSPHYNVPLLPLRAKHRIVTIHDVFHLSDKQNLGFLKKLYARTLMNAAVKKSNLIMTDSFFSKSEIEKYLVPKKEIQVVSCAVDSNIYNTNPLSFELRINLSNIYNIPSKFLLFVGNVKPHKNLLELIKALRILPEHNLVIVGKKEGFITGDTAIKSILDEDEELAKRIFFTGFVEEFDLPKIYKMADAFVFPSLYEGFGIPPLEAQASGCPVLSSNYASMPEVLADSVLYFDALNYIDIAEKILKLHTEENYDVDLIEKGIKNQQRFGWDKSAVKIMKLIKRMSQ